jgi:hypothetical protein
VISMLRQSSKGRAGKTVGHFCPTVLAGLCPFDRSLEGLKEGFLKSQQWRPSPSLAVPVPVPAMRTLAAGQGDQEQLRCLPSL